MQGLFDFLDKSVSPYHAVREAGKRLEEKGFVRLEESGEWNLSFPGRYYVTRNESSLIAFTTPEGRPRCYHMTASHSDSPAFRIKKNKAEGTYYAKAEVEGYGGMIMSSWFDRPLTFAGRVVVRTPEGVRTRLIAADKNLFVIPNLSIHFNREANKGYTYNPQIDLQPIYGGGAADLQSLIACEAAVERAEDVLDADLLLAVREKAVKAGINDEFYMAPRIDDLACAYTTLEGFLAAEEKSGVADFWCLFDNEEVGSGTRQGALGNFLSEVLARLEEACQMSAEESARVRSRSLLISADNAHAIHPNLASKSDPEFPVVLNKGIVIKYNASQKYTTTGMTAAVFAELCQREEILVQRFANRADAPGGSTLGNLLSHQVSLPMLDIGLPQLAMHSAVETAGCEDVQYMKQAIKAFYESDICQERDGIWRV
ncbi:MAG: M18 family aminopeptidase [Lachnospiraceae bacterium]|nr:M18 family aminopeptidase [Lachnospiraceae bacterium]